MSVPNQFAGPASISRASRVHMCIKDDVANFGAVVLRLLMVSAVALMWMVTPVVANTIPTTGVDSDSIHVSLPVYFTSIAATVIFTWTVAKYDNARVRKLDKLVARLEELENKLESGK